MSGGSTTEREPHATGQRLSPEARRRHLLDVARCIVERDGAAALTMEHVAEAAGVSRPLVYSYFDNRAGLLRALWAEIEQVWGSGIPSTPDELAATSSPRETYERRLVRSVRWYLDQIDRGGLLFHRLVSEPNLEESVDSLRARIREDNVAWWARLVELQGVDAERALAFSAIFNGAVESLWPLVVRRHLPREVVESVFVDSTLAALDRLIAGQAGAAPATAS
jgi:AcrR family transcriptional regulator